jgi:hypothetical protein
VNTTLLPEGKLAIVHENVGAAFTAGGEQFHPAGALTD